MTNKETKQKEKWIVDNRPGEISVTFGEKFSYSWPDVEKIIMPEANPGTPGQSAYFLRIAELLCDALNKAEIEPYCEPEPED